MKNNKKRIAFTFMMALGIMMFCTISAYAAPSSTSVPQLNVSFGDGNSTPQDYVSSIKILIFFYDPSIIAINSDNDDIFYQNSGSVFIS